VRNILKLYPAYGRAYLIPASLEQDWLAGKDFSTTVLGGPYTSIRDFNPPKFPELQGFTHVILRDVVNDVEILLEVTK
jgi:hypothetical protein